VQNSEHTLITSWDAPNPNPDLRCDQILNLQYFSDSPVACLVLAGGDIIVVREEPLPGEDRIEIVGSVDIGITSAKWSPDEELLAITTKADTVVFMSRSFEGVLDVAMTSEDLKASNHVSVGWGKKETQFKGKGAKALRDPTIPEKIDEGTLSPNDDGRTSISWRGDGAFVAISAIEEGRKRLIRVYSREGVLDSVSEPVDGLEGALSWRPAGNLIASVQRFHDHVDVVFFERNGLRHGQFSLRLTSEELETSGKHVRLAWNNDSSVLAISLANSVQLWTMGNYHWYLKQEIPVSGTGLAHSDSLIWHPERALLFVIICVGRRHISQSYGIPSILTVALDTIFTAEFILTIARGTTAPPNDFGATAVIDGKSLKVTPFRFANVPPPMALYSIDVLENVIDVAFSAENSSIAVLHLGGISLYKWNVSAKTPPPTLAGSYAFEDKASGKRQYQQISFGEQNEIITLYVEGSTPSLLHCALNEKTTEVKDNSEGLRTSLVLMISSFDHDGSNHPFTQSASGDLHSLTSGDPPLINFSFPAFLPWVEVAKNGNDYICFGLSRSGHLYAGSRLLIKNCTSFLVTPAHLIFTTTTHLLKFVHITCIEGQLFYFEI
jgi:elongator complex protein 1